MTIEKPSPARCPATVRPVPREPPVTIAARGADASLFIIAFSLSVMVLLVTAVVVLVKRSEFRLAARRSCASEPTDVKAGGQPFPGVLLGVAGHAQGVARPSPPSL